MNTPTAETKPTVSKAAATILDYLERTLEADKTNVSQTLTLAHDDIAAKTGYSVKTVQRARLYLEANGWEVLPGAGLRSTTYRLVPEGEAIQTYAGKTTDGLPLIDAALRSIAVDGIAQASHGDLAMATGLDSDTITKAVPRLIEDGWTIERGTGWRKSVYRLPTQQ